VKPPSPFASRIYDALKTHVPAGRVITYGALARLAGFPGAERAGVIIKNTFLSNSDNASVSLRKELLKIFRAN